MICSKKSTNLSYGVRNSSRGFTLIELLVSIAIFAIMTILVVAKYGNFNNSLLLTNLAYDVAGTIRTAQTYGLSVKGGASDQDFNKIYGIQFKTKNGSYACSSGYEQSDFRLIRSDDVYGGSPCPVEVLKDYWLSRGSEIASFCLPDSGGNCVTGYPIPFNTAEVTFKRPDPDAYIRFGICDSSSCTSDPRNTRENFMKITLRSPDGNTRDVYVYKNGRISVGD